MFDPRIASWRAYRQGLIGTSAAATAKDATEQFGWSRSVGGGNPYVAIWARTGRNREEVDAELAAGDIQELQAARGCTYVVGRGQYGVACRIAQGFADASAMRTARNKLGVTDEEIAVLQDHVCRVLESGPLGPQELRKALGEKVRMFGDEGKKVGTTSTLPLALGFLQTSARVRRIPLNGRLDNERYQYALWPDAPALPGREEAVSEFVRLYLDATAPAKMDALRGYSSLALKELKPAVEAMELTDTEFGLVPNHLVDEFTSWRTPDEEDVRFLGSLDNITHHQWSFAGHVMPEDGAHPIWNALGIRSGHLMDSPSHYITDRGQIVGLWEYDPDTEEVVIFTFRPATEAIRTAQSKTAQMIHTFLGDMRSFSLDSSKSRQPRLMALRSG
ncbi:MAG: winged helix DNA-binding domain-containing protein [Fimbriimonadaceae bacterium]|nr:winged helix DNA-binding domain-containing protein [Fimbriimonadaceae bacterium]